MSRRKDILMAISKPPMFLIWFCLLLCSAPQNRATMAEAARTLSIFPSQQGYSKVLATLGVVCKCCNGGGRDCTTSWTGSCPELQCLPWKLS